VVSTFKVESRAGDFLRSIQFVFMFVDDVIVEDLGHQHVVINKTSKTYNSQKCLRVFPSKLSFNFEVIHFFLSFLQS
jgi:hypothetical protein